MRAHKEDPWVLVGCLLPAHLPSILLWLVRDISWWLWAAVVEGGGQDYSWKVAKERGE